jgi:hypothetical protein
MKPETTFKIRLFGYFNKIPELWYVKTQQVSIRGTPDILLCYKGRFIAMELKRSKDATITAMQEYNIQKIAACGGIGLVVHPENLKLVLSTHFDYEL